MDWLSDFQLNLLEDCRFKGTVLGFRLVSDFTKWLRFWGMLVWGNIVLGLAKWPDDQPGQLSSLGTGVISEAAGEIGNRLLHQWIALGGWVQQLWVHSFVTKFFNIFICSIYIYIHVPIEFNLTHPYPYPNLHFVKGLSNHVFLLCHRLVDLYVLFKYNVSHPGVVVLILWNNISRLSNQIKSDEVVFIIYYHHPRFMIWQNISCRNIIYDARIHPHTNKSVQDSLNISKMLSALTLHAAVRVFLGAWRNRRESVQWRHSLEGNVSNCSASWSKVGNSGASRIVEISLYQKSWCSSDASRWNQ